MNVSSKILSDYGPHPGHMEHPTKLTDASSWSLYSNDSEGVLSNLKITVLVI